MATKLKLFNAALRAIGSNKVTDTGDTNESARSLVDVYDDVVADCLETGSWNFAVETIKVAADTGVTPEFGFSEVFAKPSDWVRTVAVSEDEYFSYPLLHYYDDSNFWSADTSPIFVRFVSSDTGLGLDLTRWPASFRRFVELELASRVCMRLTQSNSLEDRTMAKRDKARKNALNKDAMNEPNPRFPPPGRVTQARSGRIGWGDRGSRNSLTGG